MKPAWDQLGDDYASSSSVVIADVDCTVEQDLCSKYDVKGYPTIKYFTSETDEKGEDYGGGRSLDDLKKFVADTLEVKWCVSLPGLCPSLTFESVLSDLLAGRRADAPSRLLWPRLYHARLTRSTLPPCAPPQSARGRHRL